jgi:hypothetical protein
VRTFSQTSLPAVRELADDDIDVAGGLPGAERVEIRLSHFAGDVAATRMAL